MKKVMKQQSEANVLKTTIKFTVRFTPDCGGHDWCIDVPELDSEKSYELFRELYDSNLSKSVGLRISEARANRIKLEFPKVWKQLERRVSLIG
jgi:hypothetical protein